MPTYNLDSAHGQIRIETVNVFEIEMMGVAELFERIADKSLDVLEGFQIMAESLPTRGELIYHCLNKPWEKQNWELLATGWRVTRRKVRKARAELEDMKHARWARKLNTGKEFRAQ
ncbi:gp84 [Mycobacterium phage Predator]|uniref:Uncharacterized protein n=1 Tax=Mycobacterium phage Predator TaxID=543153 RepID=B3VMB1_9CAUD|nr:gp84 [Mycobacterium phage Predator]ACF05181.1 hypothetical protein PREDATOR_84 [Mycobacterium phage Predator]